MPAKNSGRCIRNETSFNLVDNFSIILETFFWYLDRCDAFGRASGAALGQKIASKALVIEISHRDRVELITSSSYLTIALSSYFMLATMNYGYKTPSKS